MKSEFRFGVVGHKIGYSRSPDIFEAVSKMTGVSCGCTLHDIAPEHFQAEFLSVLKSGIDGFSVTIPFKKAVIPFMDEIDSVAAAVGAVNSVAIRDGRVYGYNTDSGGFATPLESHKDVLKEGTAIVFGAGGAARAVVYSLLENCDVSRTVVIGRSKANLDELRAGVTARWPDVAIETMTGDRYRAVAYDIAVNATPLGGWNHLDESPFPDAFEWLKGKIYYDLSYNTDNKLVAHALDRGMVAYDGSRMLVAQAVRSIYHWSGLEVDYGSVYRAVFDR